MALLDLLLSPGSSFPIIIKSSSMICLNSPSISSSWIKTFFASSGSLSLKDFNASFNISTHIEAMRGMSISGFNKGSWLSCKACLAILHASSPTLSRSVIIFKTEKKNLSSSLTGCLTAIMRRHSCSISISCSSTISSLLITC